MLLTYSVTTGTVALEARLAHNTGSSGVGFLQNIVIRIPLLFGLV